MPAQPTAPRDAAPTVRLIERPDGSVRLSASDRAKLARIAWLKADNAADEHPSFERLARLAVVGEGGR
jgi:hypothetical protein